MSKKLIKFFLSLIFLSSSTIIVFADNKTYINTENIIYDEKNKIVELAKNSKININETSILIDKGIIDINEGTIQVFGNFYLNHYSGILSGKDLMGNSNLDKYSANGVSFLYDNNLKIDSEKIEKDGLKINFYENFLTSCKINGYFNCPTWSFRVNKTEYDLEKDKFIHYDAFLQIADYKILYLPYFSHYGTKAPRQKGFLTPSFQLTIGENTSISAPYYIPIDGTSDLIITPKIIFNENLNFDENFNLTSVFDKKNTNGFIKIALENVKKDSESSLYSTWTVNSKQVINKNSIVKANALFTNSTSTSRSLNEEPIPFEDLSISLENYNYFKKNDFLKFEISSVESFDQVNDSLVPTNLSISYINSINQKNFYLKNNLIVSDIKRNFSDNDNPYENINFGIENTFSQTQSFNKIINYNVVTLYNSYNEYSFSHNSSLNRTENISNLSLSSEFNYNFDLKTTGIMKVIFNREIANNSDLINEKSNALTFNYNNQYSDNRNYGYEESQDFFRVVYGFEKFFNFKNNDISFKINQSYDFEKDDNYLNKINQTSKLSDYALELQSNFEKINFKLDSRIDSENLAKKEMNYSFSLEDEFKFEATYNETDKNAFKESSNDSKSLSINLSKDINKNFMFSLSSNLDLKNNFSPYTNSLKLSFMDECSQLDLSYLNNRYSDNFNTKPEESIQINFLLDYIGLFGLEEKTNLINIKN